MREKVLEIRNLSISFTTSQGKVNAIRGVELDLYRGETFPGTVRSVCFITGHYDTDISV